MNAIELLEKQHEEVLSLLGELESLEPGQERKQAFKEVQSSLLAHMVIEEELFYPTAAKLDVEEREPIVEGYEEHIGARAALDRCARAIGDEMLFGVRIGVLKEMIKHHIKEEREMIFPRVKKEMEVEELEALGEELEQRFEKAKKGASPAEKLDRMSTSRERQAMSP